MSKLSTESIRIEGEELLAKVRELIHEGNVRRIVIKQGGNTVVEVPLTVGVVGAVFAPVLAAVGALAAMVTDCTIDIEREAPATDPATLASSATDQPVV